LRLVRSAPGEAVTVAPHCWLTAGGGAFFFMNYKIKGESIMEEKKERRTTGKGRHENDNAVASISYAAKSAKVVSKILQDGDLFIYDPNIVCLMAATLLDDVVGQLNTIGSELSNTFEADYGLA